MASRSKSSDSAPDPGQPSKADFESSLSELERIVAELESGDLTLTESIARYERGVGLLRKCHEALDSARLKIEMLTRVRDDRTAETVPWGDATGEDGDPDTEPPREKRARRRKTPGDEDNRLF